MYVICRGQLLVGSFSTNFFEAYYCLDKKNNINDRIDKIKKKVLKHFLSNAV